MALARHPAGLALADQSSTTPCFRHLRGFGVAGRRPPWLHLGLFSCVYVHGKPRDSRYWLSDTRGGQRGSRPNAGGAAEGCHAYEHEGVAAPGGTLSPHSSRGRVTYVACRPFTLCARMVLRGGHAGSSLRFMETDSIPCPEGRLLQRRVVSRPSRAVSVLVRRQTTPVLVGRGIGALATTVGPAILGSRLLF